MNLSIPESLAKLNLNQEQLAAATNLSGHTLLLAGAGSGKTRVIIGRCTYLLDKGVDPSRILVLTFTRNAARELKERLLLQFGEKAKGVNASTFHTFAIGLIHKMPRLFGRGWQVIDSDDQLQIMRLLRGKKNKELPTAAQLISMYSYSRNVCVPIEEAVKKSGKVDQSLHEDVLQIFRDYAGRKRDRLYMDYDDILVMLASRLAKDEKLRAVISSMYSHIMVDEMQDTNPLQWKILDQLKEPGQLFCVGDDAQSIYAFRGADFRNVHSFTDRVPGSKLMKLVKNYRSTQEILDISNWLLDNSPLNYDKRLEAHRGAGIKPVIRNFPHTSMEASWVIQDIKRRYNDEGAKWQEHMILVRSAFMAREIEFALIAANVPYQYVGGTKLMESAHVRDVLALMRIVANYRDELGWIRYLTMFPKIGDVTAVKLIDAVLEQVTLDEGVAELAKDKKMPAGALAGLNQVMGFEQSPVVALQKSLEHLEPMLQERYSADWDRRKKDFTLVAQLAAKHGSILEMVEEYLLDPMTASQVEKSEDNDIVTLITIHSAKGTEAPVCYLPLCEPGNYPHSRSLESEDEFEEERRVLYVAMTRAKNELIISRSGYDYAAPSKPESAREEDDDDPFDFCLPVTLNQQPYFLSGLPDEMVEEEWAAR